MRVQSPVDSIYLSTPEYAKTSSTLQSGIGSGDSPFTLRDAIVRFWPSSERSEENVGVIFTKLTGHKPWLYSEAE